MSEPPQVDTISFPGGCELDDSVIAVKLAAMKHVPGDVPFGEVDSVIVERFLQDLTTRHPEIVPYGDPYTTRGQELFDQRSSLVHSHLRLPWFTLAYWAYGLIAVRSRLSVAEYDDTLRIFLVPVQGALRELGVQVSEEECVEEIDRFLPRKVSARSVEAAAYTFLSFVRFLHHAALRRRRFVTPRLALPGVGLAFDRTDAEEATQISAFLVSHGVHLIQQDQEVTPPARLLVVLSRTAIQSDTFWRDLAAWKQHPVIPMVLCLMPRTELYHAPPADTWTDLWNWLVRNVAVEVSAQPDRYLVLLRALDSPDPKQWWWHRDDAIELGLTVEGLGEPPRPPARPARSAPTGEPYPYVVDGRLLLACLLASQPERLDDETGRDVGFVEACTRLLALRQKPGGQPYALPWFMLAYRAWKAFAVHMPDFASSEDAEHSRLELRMALFALGIGTQPQEVTAFLETFARLPWHEPSGSIAGCDERTTTFIVLVHHLSQAALACGQRVRLQHPVSGCFVSYAREDETVARELVTALEAKGADVWWDVNAITMGTPLDDSLRSAVADARFLLLMATPAADGSPYVRLEIDTAIQHGLRIIPIVSEEQLPPGIAAMQASAPGSFDPPISIAVGEQANAFALVLARLQRTPPEQLRWLQAQPLYDTLSRELRQARMRGGVSS